MQPLWLSINLQVDTMQLMDFDAQLGQVLVTSYMQVKQWMFLVLLELLRSEHFAQFQRLFDCPIGV